MVELKDDIAATDFAGALDADIILDFLYGAPALALLQALQPPKPVQYMQIGSSAGADVVFPAALLRSKDLTMRGSGFGTWPMSRLGQENPKMIEAIASGKIKEHRFQEVKLEDIEAAWAQKGGERMVIIP
jgi:NADPH:quinone reductase-like Zn-dependent oxidoreductase